MPKIKRMINFGLPVTACNLRCSYCYVSQAGWNTNEMGKLEYTPEHIQRCMTKERLGGICHVIISGSGETLLPSYSIELIRRMLENGHIVSIATNGTITKRIEELCAFPQEQKDRLFIKFSFHFLELKRLGLLDSFFSNIERVRESGCSYTLELGADDQYVPYVEEIHRICRERLHADCHVIELRQQHDEFDRLTKMSAEARKTVWGEFKSPLFDYQQTVWGEKRCEFCYAGEWLLQLDGGTGWTYPCYIGGDRIQNIFENPDEPIRTVAIGSNCPWAHCYPAHVLLTSGIIPEIEAPTYLDVRDRETTDGHTWLTPTVAEFFSSKFIESNTVYSEEKKAYINALMALEYKNRAREILPQEVADAVEASLRARGGVRSVGIWGTNLYADWLIALLMRTDIQVKYFVDPDIAMLPPENTVAEPEAPEAKALPPLKTRYDHLEQVDAMIITDFAHFNSVSKEIPPVYERLLSITELAD